jgi:hypothetical protein
MTLPLHWGAVFPGDAMLENGTLLLRPCVTFPAGVSGPQLGLEPAHVVQDALTGAILGFAGWRKGGGFWPRWLSRPVLAVHESDDAPLLFTVHSLWGLAARWEVRDADGNIVGVLSGPLLKDRLGRSIALWERGGDLAARVREADGRDLMTLAALADGTRVTFAAEVDGNPFLKMLLLAAALTQPLAA